jgi:hypothetical protein
LLIISFRAEARARGKHERPVMLMENKMGEAGNLTCCYIDYLYADVLPPGPSPAEDNS